LFFIDCIVPTERKITLSFSDEEVIINLVNATYEYVSYIKKVLSPSKVGLPPTLNELLEQSETVFKKLIIENGSLSEIEQRIVHQTVFLEYLNMFQLSYVHNDELVNNPIVEVW
jgi:hypothetical protein